MEKWLSSILILYVYHSYGIITVPGENGKKLIISIEHVRSEITEGTY